MIEPALQTLLDACQEGNLNAQRRLYERHKERLFRVCLRFAKDRGEAQDMLQETFIRIYRDLSQFKGEGSFEAWTRKIAVRCALTQLRKKNRLQPTENLEQFLSTDQVFVPDTERTSEAILQMLQKMPDNYRIIFNLRCIEELSYEEIAAELGIEESSARSQYSRACSALRRMVTHMFINNY